MEISDHGFNLKLSGPFDPNEAGALIAAIQDKNVVSLHVSGLSADDGEALTELLIEGLQPWLEKTDGEMDLFVVEPSDTFPNVRLLAAPGIRVVTAWHGTSE
jgi:hypothetical protein